MKKLFIFLFIIVFININCYQPPEFGLFFEKSPRMAQNNMVVSKTINLNKEKLINGKNSDVFLIKNLAEFLHLSSTSKIPLIINLYSKKNENKLKFQEVAKNFKEKFVFLNVDSSKNAQLTQFLLLFLRLDGFTILPSKIEYPLILICNPGSILLQNGLMHLKKGGLQKLLDMGHFDKTKLKKKLQKY